MSDLPDTTSNTQSIENQLKERIKELNCLYSISSIVEIPSITLPETLQKIVDVLPPAWQYSQVACARIVLQNDEYKTANFRETQWKQSTDIVIGGIKKGIVEVYYLEKASDSAEELFLPEEGKLISAVAERLGKIVERAQKDESLKASETLFRTLFETSSDAIMTFEPPSLKYTTANSACIKMFGMKDEAEFLRHDPVELSPQTQPDGKLSSEKAKEMLEIALKNGSNKFDWTHKRLSGETFETVVNLVRVQIGNKTICHATVKDISKQKEVEDMQRQSLTYLEKYKELVVGRELRMIELKKENEDLKNEISKLKSQLPGSQQNK